LAASGSPCGTQKRKLMTLETPSLGEDVFIFDVFGKDNDDDLRSRPCRLKMRPLPRLRMGLRITAVTGPKSHWRTREWGYGPWQYRAGPGVVGRRLADGSDPREIGVGVGIRSRRTKTTWLAEADLDLKLLRRFRVERRRAAPRVPTRRLVRLQAGEEGMERRKRI